MIRPDEAMAAVFAPVEYSWTNDDVIRYHLAIGAGSPVCGGPELRYVYEDRLVVLPTFTVLPASAAAAVAARAPGLDYDPALILQIEHQLDVLGPVPTAAATSNQARVEAVYDTGRACSFVVTVVTTDVDGTDLAVNRFVMLLPGEGGFGGRPAPRPAPVATARRPDSVYRIETLPQQSALFRMVGDRHPLHIDPEIATAAGFGAPPMAGLCTWSMVAKALVDRELDGQPERMTGFRARFATPVYPGDALDVSVWRNGKALDVEASVRHRESTVLKAGVFVMSGEAGCR